MARTKQNQKEKFGLLVPNGDDTTPNPISPEDSEPDEASGADNDPLIPDNTNSVNSAGGRRSRRAKRASATSATDDEPAHTNNTGSTENAALAPRRSSRGKLGAAPATVATNTTTDATPATDVSTDAAVSAHADGAATADPLDNHTVGAHADGDTTADRVSSVSSPPHPKSFAVGPPPRKNKKKKPASQKPTSSTSPALPAATPIPPVSAPDPTAAPPDPSTATPDPSTATHVSSDGAPASAPPVGSESVDWRAAAGEEFDNALSALALYGDAGDDTAMPPATDATALQPQLTAAEIWRKHRATHAARQREKNAMNSERWTLPIPDSDVDDLARDIVSAVINNDEKARAAAAGKPVSVLLPSIVEEVTSDAELRDEGELRKGKARERGNEEDLERDKERGAEVKKLAKGKHRAKGGEKEDESNEEGDEGEVKKVAKGRGRARADEEEDEGDEEGDEGGGEEGEGDDSDDEEDEDEGDEDEEDEDEDEEDEGDEDELEDSGVEDATRERVPGNTHRARNPSMPTQPTGARRTKKTGPRADAEVNTAGLKGVEKKKALARLVERAEKWFEQFETDAAAIAEECGVTLKDARNYMLQHPRHKEKGKKRGYNVANAKYWDWCLCWRKDHPGKRLPKMKKNKKTMEKEAKEWSDEMLEDLKVRFLASRARKVVGTRATNGAAAADASPCRKRGSVGGAATGNEDQVMHYKNFKAAITA
ncbi:hypothetical protein R3P38DRAFT_2810985, partial [Favolaschia claudopus]